MPSYREVILNIILKNQLNMKNFTLFVFLLSASTVFAQQPGGNPPMPQGNGRITGVIMDSLDNVPVQSATVALNNPATGRPIDGTVADEKGKFTLVKVSNGNFNVVISFVGYATKTFPITITDKNDVINLGIIKFSFGSEFLKDVVVEGQRNLIEEKVDRTVYNAENDNTTKGGDASDVMRRVPMLSVDLDGNVSMRGNSNVRVLINNKPSTIMASSVADALKQIPADQIKSIEVITSPSAKYDAEGSAGIINIITKKNNMQGLTLNIDAGAGLRGSNLGLNGNYRKGKMGFSLGGFGRAGYNVRGSFDNTQVRTSYFESTPIDTVTTVQSARTLRQDLHGRYQLGWDYEINKNNSLAASVRFGLRNNWNYQNDLSTKTFDGNGNPISNSLKQSDTKDLSGNVDINLDYTRLFEKPQREFSFLTLYSRNNRTNDFETITDPLNNSALTGRLNNNQSYNQEVTIQGDYQTPIGEKQLVEVGAKHISRIVSSQYQSFNSIDGGTTYNPVGDNSLSNNFNYDQNVSAGYLSYTYNSKNKYSFKAGGRYEYTTILADFAQASSETPDVSSIPSYGAFVPSINVSRKLKAGNTLKAAYNRRIQRPSIQFLNPNIQSANPLIVTKGNPNLSPEYTDNFELSYSSFIKATTLNFSAFYRNTTGSIQSVRSAKGDTLFTNYANIGKESAYGLNFFGNVAIGKNFSVNGGVDSYYAMLNNNKTGVENVQNAGWVFSGRLFGNYNLKNGWGLQFFSFFRGRQVNLQGYQGGFRMYSLAVRKEFNEKRGSFGIGIENFAQTSLKIKGEIQSTTYNLVDPNYSTALNQYSTNVMYNLSFRANFSYRIGKMSFENNNRRRKKSINNDDLKGEGGGDGGGGGGNMEQGQRGGAPPTGVRPGAGPNNGQPKTKEELEKDKKKKKPEEKKGN